MPDQHWHAQSTLACPINTGMPKQYWHALSTLAYLINTACSTLVWLINAVCSTLTCLIKTTCSTPVWLINKLNITTFNHHYKLKHCIQSIHFNRSLFQICSTLHFQPTGYGLFHMLPICPLHMTKHHHNTQTSFQYHLINL